MWQPEGGSECRGYPDAGSVFLLATRVRKSASLVAHPWVRNDLFPIVPDTINRHTTLQALRASVFPLFC